MGDSIKQRLARDGLSRLGEELRDSIHLTLPWPPTINHYYGNRPRGGKYIKAAGKAFRILVHQVVVAAGRPSIKGKVKLRVVAYPPDRRRRDLDNLLKASLDALEESGVYENDADIWDFGIRWAVDDKGICVVDGGKLVVTIQQREGE